MRSKSKKKKKIKKAWVATTALHTLFGTTPCEVPGIFFPRYNERKGWEKLCPEVICHYRVK